MSGARRYGCCRSLRSELARLVPVLAMPLAIMCVFPRRSVGFVAAKSPEPRAPSCAFVRLTEAEEAALLAASRSAWRVDPGDVRTLRTDLSIDALPDGPVVPMMAERPASAPVPRALTWVSSLLPPGCGAAAPARIPVETPGERGAEAFPREELLNIEWTTKGQVER